VSSAGKNRVGGNRGISGTFFRMLGPFSSGCFVEKGFSFFLKYPEIAVVILER
jgi:hypothetical protein